MHFHKSLILQEDLPMFPLSIFKRVCCCYASLQASSPIGVSRETYIWGASGERSEPQSSCGQFRLPFAPSVETPDWRASLQATVMRMFVSFLVTKSLHYRSFFFSFYILVASYPTYHSFYFKWSCLNLGSKSCGKYV